MKISKEKEPLVSILMNCYNGGEFLNEAIESVLNQTYTNWELIFWDNQSTDDSAQICKSYKDPRIKYYYSEKHTKLYEARNLAIDKTEGEYIAFLDTDDVWDFEKLEVQVSILVETDFDIVCSNYYMKTDGYNIFSKAYYLPKKSGLIFFELLKRYYIGILTIIIRKEILVKNNYYFDHRYNHIGDYDLFIRLSKLYPIYYLNKPLAEYRIHGNSLSKTKGSEFLEEYYNWIEEKNNLNYFENNSLIINFLNDYHNYLSKLVNLSNCMSGNSYGTIAKINCKLKIIVVKLVFYGKRYLFY